MHDQTYILRCGIPREFPDIEIRIRFSEIKHMFVPGSEPVFPSRIPSFHEHALDIVGRCEIYIAFDVGGIRAMFSVGDHFSVRAETVWKLRIAPGTFVRLHFPPYAAEFHGFYPGCIIQCTGLVEVEDKPGRQHLFGAVTDNDGSPRRFERGMEVSLVSISI